MAQAAIDSAAENAKPSESPFPIKGLTEPGFEPIRQAFIDNFHTGKELGAGFAVWDKNRLVVDLVGGWTDKNQKQLFSHDTLVPVYSTSKGIAAIVIARILEEHPNADFETKIAEIWPEFAANGKDNITIAQLLSHQAGLPGFAETIDRSLWSNWRECAAKLAALPPLWPPGTKSGYHPTTWGYLVAELALRLSGRPFGAALQQYLIDADRKENIDFHIGLDKKQHQRCAEMIRPTTLPEFDTVTDATKAAFMMPWSRNDMTPEQWRLMEIPSSNGHGTARSIARLYGIYAQNGCVGGQRLLSKDSYIGLTGSRVKGVDCVIGHEIEFGAGIVRNNYLVFGPVRKTLAHAGWGGSFGLGDPVNQISAAYVMNRQSASLQIDERGQKLIKALYECLPKLDRRRNR